MKRYGNRMVYTHEELMQRYYGPVGTPLRDAFEAEVERDVLEYRARKAIERAAKGYLLSLPKKN